jgi:dTDP-4-dehydrorhamnose reductase
MLGRDFCEVARAKGHVIAATDRADVVSGTDLSALDVTDLAAVREALEKVRPGIVFHFAALADVDRCETHPDEGYLANVIGTENVALACAAADLTLVFLREDKISRRVGHSKNRSQTLYLQSGMDVRGRPQR